MSDRHNGYMPFPHTFTDRIMPLVGSSEWKVFHIIIRCTLGWCKVWDEISISQFVARTGMTRQCVSSALDTACKRGIIQANKTNRQRIEYALIYPDMESAEELVKNLNEKTRQNILQELVKKLDKSYEELVKKIDQFGRKVVKKSNRSDRKLVKKLDIQKIVPKDTSKESRNVGGQPTNPQDRILENGMTWGELRSILQKIKIGILTTLHRGENADFLRYIETQPKERIEEVIQMDGVKGAPTQYILERMYQRLEGWDYYQSKKPKAPPTFQQRLDEATANLDYYQKQVDADPRNATDELCIETLAQLQSHIDDIKEMQNADTATAG